jgi:hypothetical protein
MRFCPRMMAWFSATFFIVLFTSLTTV